MRKFIARIICNGYRELMDSVNPDSKEAKQRIEYYRQQMEKWAS